MGQALSKRLVTPRLQALQEKYNKKLLEEVKTDIASKQKRAAELSSSYTDINALEGGFQRGGQKTVREVEQEEFLRKESSSSEEGNAGLQEMPEDLIKFLNDAGPVQRQIDKTQTSPRLYETLAKQEEERRQLELQKPSPSSSSSSSQQQQKQGSDGRTRRRMPMVEHLENTNDEKKYYEGEMMGKEVEDKTYAMMTTTERTTNFSKMENTEGEEEEDLLNLRLENEEICTLLNAHLIHGGKWGGGGEGGKVSASPVAHLGNLKEDGLVMTGGGPITPSMLSAAEHSAKAHLDSILPTTTTTLTPEEQTTQKANTLSLLQNTLLHTSIPTLMKDTDGTLIAVWDNRIQEMSFRGLDVLDLESGVVGLTVENGGVGFDKQEGG